MSRQLARCHTWMTFGVVALTGWALLWELWLAPLRPGGSWIALKAVPLMLTLPGLLRARTKTLQWLSLLLPFYFAESVVRVWSEHGRSAWCAGVALGFSLLSFGALLGYFYVLKKR